MNKKNFTLEDIENMLEEFGFIWLERLVYNPNTNKYKQLKVNNFSGKPRFISIKNIKSNVRALVLAEIYNEKFVISSDKYKLDASEAWQDYLNEKVEAKTNEC